jgi:lysophospholipase L1-like esterase
MNIRRFPATAKAAMVAQLLFGAGAIALALSPGMPRIPQIFLGLVLLCGLAVSILVGGSPETGSIAVGRTALWLRRMTWIFVIATCATALSMQETFGFWDTSIAWIASLMAASFLAAYFSTHGKRDGQFLKGVAWVWAAVAVAHWIGAAYLHNLVPAFYGGLLMILGLGVALRFWFRLTPTGIQTINTILLLTLALPVADWIVASHRSNATIQVREHPYRYEIARRDPGRFSAWWQYYQQAWNLMARDIFIPDPEGRYPLRLRPGGDGHLMESRIVINQHGFRGRELDEYAVDAYRIVALGESTTFGCTLLPEDKPWPELLEKLIRERLRPHRPVHVINAGVPAYTLADNVRRFEAELLPLRPDLIISYHGYNGFSLLRSAVPPIAGDHPSTYQRRPLVLLAQLEHRLHQRSLRNPSQAPRPTTADRQSLLETDYAARYRDLIRLAETAGAQLALCTFAMAVDGQSATDLLEFYRPAFPAVRWQVAANEAHSSLLQELQREHPHIVRIDTGPALDGQHEHYIDLVHLTQEGRERLAESIFNDLAPLLRKQLSPP